MSDTTHNPRPLNKPALVQAAVDPSLKGKTVKPVRRRRQVTVVADGQVKAKQLQSGQRVKPVVRGEAVGGIRIVSRTERENDGAVTVIVWRNGYTASRVPAAQRFVNVDEEGTTTTETQLVHEFAPVR